MWEIIVIVFSMVAWSLLLLAHGFVGIAKSKIRFLFKRDVIFTGNRAFVYSATSAILGVAIAIVLGWLVLSGQLMSPEVVGTNFTKFNRHRDWLNNVVGTAGVVSFGITIVVGIACSFWEGLAGTKS